MLFGPADEHGELVVAAADFGREYQRQVSTGIMDYGPWLGEEFVAPVRSADVGNLREGFHTWKRGIEFPADYERQLDALEQRLAAVQGTELRVYVGGEFNGKVMTLTRTA
jgi:ABC-type Fe3+-hydroxamate transport system substrate-binding protein